MFKMSRDNKDGKKTRKENKTSNWAIVVGRALI